MYEVIYDFISEDESCYGIKEPFDTEEKALEFIESLRNDPYCCNIDMNDLSCMYD